MKQWIIGDIHGGYKALLQCLERSGADKKKDEFFVVGDVCDGWPEVKQCMDELMTFKNLVYIIGNHDLWFYNFCRHDEREEIWISQGGWNTLKSFDFKPDNKYADFFENANIYVEDEEKSWLFVHGGINPNVPIESHRTQDIMWNRDLFRTARTKQLRWECSVASGKEIDCPTLSKYKEIFIGHTTTLLYDTTEPCHFCNVWNLDTGGGWYGKLTIMDLNTKEYWQSDLVQKFYPDCHGRDDYKRWDPAVLAFLNGKNMDEVSELSKKTDDFEPKFF